MVGGCRSEGHIISSPHQHIKLVGQLDSSWQYIPYINVLVCKCMVRGSRRKGNVIHLPHLYILLEGWMGSQLTIYPLYRCRSSVVHICGKAEKLWSPVNIEKKDLNVNIGLILQTSLWKGTVLQTWCASQKQIQKNRCLFFHLTLLLEYFILFFKSKNFLLLFFLYWWTLCIHIKNFPIFIMKFHFLILSKEIFISMKSLSYLVLCIVFSMNRRNEVRNFCTSSNISSEVRSSAVSSGSFFPFRWLFNLPFLVVTSGSWIFWSILFVRSFNFCLN